MTSKYAATPDLSRDPFSEYVPALVSRSVQMLGARFLFESNSRELLALALVAFGGLPGHRLSNAEPRMRIRLLLEADPPARGAKRTEGFGPPPLVMFSGAGLLGGTRSGNHLVVISPQDLSALVVVPQRMLRFPYHTRYELIEFAVYTLAARVQKLVPLHAACVGQKGRGVLLMGASGAGKSTVTLQSMLQGLDFLAEDSLFVEPRRMLATAVSNFIHVRSDSLHWVERAKDVKTIRESPVIRRRSGVRKFEVDLRRGRFQLAQVPLEIGAVVFLTAASSGGGPLLNRLAPRALGARLSAEQAYAAAQPEWPVFLRNVARLPAFELRRGRHPQDSVDALRDLLA